MPEWPDLREQTNAALVAGPLGEWADYWPADGRGPFERIRVIFDLEGMETDLASGLRVATGVPTLSLRDADIGGKAAKRDDLVAIGGTNYLVRSRTPGGRGWSECKLHAAA